MPAKKKEINKIRHLPRLHSRVTPMPCIPSPVRFSTIAAAAIAHTTTDGVHVLGILKWAPSPPPPFLNF